MTTMKMPEKRAVDRDGDVHDARIEPRSALMSGPMLRVV